MLDIYVYVQDIVCVNNAGYGGDAYRLSKDTRKKERHERCCRGTLQSSTRRSKQRYNNVVIS